MTKVVLPSIDSAAEFWRYAENFISQAGLMSAAADTANQKLLDKAGETRPNPTLERLKQSNLDELKSDAGASLFDGATQKLDEMAAHDVGVVKLQTAQLGAMQARDMAASHQAAVALTGQVLERWFPGVATIQSRVEAAFSSLINRTDLMAEYARLDALAAQQITLNLKLQAQREEEDLLDQGARMNTPTIPGPVLNQLKRLRDKLHEDIMAALEKLGGDGLQRDYKLVMGLLDQQLRMRHEAIRSFGSWVGGVDQRGYAASVALDRQLSEVDLAKLDSLMTVSREMRGLESEALRVASPMVKLANQEALAPVARAVRGLEGEVKAFQADARQVSAMAASTYNRLNARVSGSGSESMSEVIDLRPEE